MTATPLSAVVITRNEAANIARCIQSLRQVTVDIVVVDSGSTDRTREIAEEMGARVFHRDWTGYADQKNFGNEKALHDYILSIDADECLSFELAFQIQEAMKQPKAAVYEMDFLTSWGDHFIRHGGWVPDRHCRLFDKRRIRWVSEGVHEYLAMDGHTPQKIEGYVFHYTAANKQTYREKMNRYAREFAEARSNARRYSPFWKKYTSAGFRFLRDYVLKRGFLEGRAGWEIACEEARYTWLKYRWSEKP
ncbi:MAG: glycosyltransferase family 2 protein [Chitinophagaceae bacterium]